MPRRVRSIVLFLLMTCAMAWLVPSASAAPPVEGDLAIVVHPDTPVSDLTFAELRQLFLGDRQYWTPDLPVVLFIRAPTSSERDAVLNEIYRMKEPQFKQYWIAKIFRAEMPLPPKIVYSSESAGQFVATVPGGIAFMAASEVPPGLKVLKIDGHLPGDPAYRLHLASK